MRVNIYAEEMTDRLEIITKEIDGHKFTALRFYLELPCTVPTMYPASGYTTNNIRGPFIHRPGDDDSAAVTFWGKQDLRPLLRKALEMLDEHYASKEASDKIEMDPIIRMNRYRAERDLVVTEIQSLRTAAEGMEKAISGLLDNLVSRDGRYFWIHHNKIEELSAALIEWKRVT